MSPVLKPCPAEVSVVELPPTPVVFIVFEFDLTKTPIGAVFPSTVIWKWVVSFAVGVVISEPVIVVSTTVDSRPNFRALVSFAESTGNENCEAEIVLPADM